METGQGRGGGGRTRRTGGTEGAVRRKRLEGVGDLEDGGREEKRGEGGRGGGPLDKQMAMSDSDMGDCSETVTDILSE